MRRAWNGWLWVAFALNILALLFAIYCAVLVIVLRYCPMFGSHCDHWTRHVPDALRALSLPACALVGTIFGIRHARRGESGRAIRALLGWSALSLAALMSFAVVPME